MQAKGLQQENLFAISVGLRTTWNYYAGQILSTILTRDTHEEVGTTLRQFWSTAKIADIGRILNLVADANVIFTIIFMSAFQHDE